MKASRSNIDPNVSSPSRNVPWNLCFDVKTLSERYVNSALHQGSLVMKFSTKAIHAGQNPDPATGSVTVPVYLTSTYMQVKPGREGKYVYSRTANPTRNALETSLASLEDGKVGLAFSSGLAATTTVLMLL